MRALFFLSVGVVLVLVGFNVYLEIDKKQFIEKLHQVPSVTQPNPNNSRGVPFETSENPVQLGDLNRQVDISDFSADGSASVIEGSKDIHESQDVNEDSLQETEDFQFSHELEVLFNTFHSLDEKILELSVEIDPLINERIAIDDRGTEILHTMNRGVDSSTQDVLNEEKSALSERANELNPTLFELQDKRREFILQQDTLLDKYGFPSRVDFVETIGDVYEAWKVTQ